MSRNTSTPWLHCMDKRFGKFVPGSSTDRPNGKWSIMLRWQDGSPDSERLPLKRPVWPRLLACRHLTFRNLSILPSVNSRRLRIPGRRSPSSMRPPKSNDLMLSGYAPSKQKWQDGTASRVDWLSTQSVKASRRTTRGPHINAWSLVLPTPTIVATTSTRAVCPSLPHTQPTSP